MNQVGPSVATEHQGSSAVQWRHWSIALSAALSAFVAANALEAGLMRLTGGDAWDLAYVSDIILSLLVLVATYLWLHARALRGQLTALERERVAADTELALAARIQRAALGAVAAPRPGLLWFAETRPAGKVGGDFYDLITLEDGATLILVADVSGKGVPAALGLASARAAFRMTAQSLGDPQEIVRRWSRWLHAEMGGAPYLTAVLVRINAACRRLTYVNAGHPAGLLVWPTGVRLLETTCAPLGLLPGLEPGAVTVELPRGAVGLLVTDGVSEALEEGGDPLVQMTRLARAGFDRPLEELARSLLEVRGATRAERLAPPDDQTVVAFRVEV
jgi:phosphoserine phosphatase RsbU/P